MVLNDEEYKAYHETNKRKKKQLLLSEQYEVKFRYKKDDGYWDTRTITYHAETKDAHDEVTEKWRIDFPYAVQLINVTYL